MSDLQTDKIRDFSQVIANLFGVITMYNELEKDGRIRYTVDPGPYFDLVTGLLKESHELLTPYISE